MAGWYWQFDPLIVANATFDVVCFSTCLYLLAPIRQRSSSMQGSTASPQTNISTPSIWSRKRWDLVTAATVATLLWHFLRFVLVVVLSFHSVRHAKLQHEAEMKAANSTEGTVSGPIEIDAGNPFTQQPAFFIVTVLPALAVISRAFIVSAFAWVQKSFAPLSSTVTGKHEQEAPKSPASPTYANQKTSLPVSSSSQLSLGHFLTDLPARIHGPRQNLYLLAFYFCIAALITFVPFTYHFVWYIDTPRIEFVATLYLAAVLQDSKNVPGLSNKEKRQRGIPSFQRLVNLRWLGLLVLFVDFFNELVWRAILDGTMVFIIWRFDTLV
ncbi:hypothetical protein CPB86DRAFT_692648 [Serendipita vermifera]|nr:hypothetical protein CPB86DRAFT_692648 [Serendipita vermifera]